MKKEEVKEIVREGYAKVARERGGAPIATQSCCGPQKPQAAVEEKSSTVDVGSCCGPAPVNLNESAKRIGYTDAELVALPEGANLSLGCGNPTAFASLKEGETVLDLGSGAGFDVFIAASKVGKTGKVIGVDMTPEMLDLARKNAAKSSYKNVEFRLGEIENLPVADNTVDCIISNCVINLSPDKNKVFSEAFRALRPGGRLMVSDLVLLRELLPKVRESVGAYIGCIAGAQQKDEYLGVIKSAGFKDVKIVEETDFSAKRMTDEPAIKEMAKSLNIAEEDLRTLASSVLSIRISGIKP